MNPENEATPAKSISWIDFLLVGCLAVSLSGNVLQGWRLRSLSVNNTPPPPKSVVGMSLPEIRAKTLSDKPVVLSLKAAQPTVLYIFRPTCQWCAANMSNIQFLSSQRASQAHFVGISITDDGLKEYLDRNPLPFPVYVVTDQAELKELGFAGTPQTLEVGRDGKISEDWIGAYTGDVAAAIASHFTITLPGLIPGEKEKQ